MDSLNLKKYQFVFVGGILGEMLKLNFIASYFEDSKKILMDLGAREVSIYQPNSILSPEENSRDLVTYLNALYKTHGKKVILLCHSKGCLEALFSLIKYPNLMNRMVHKIFCVQPPFKGSVLTDYYSKTFKVGSTLWPGLKCLGRNSMRDSIEKIPNETKKLIESKMIIVKGTKPERIAWILKVSHRKLAKRGVVSDGLLALEDQELEGFNISKIQIPMDHSDLFTSKTITNASIQFKNQVMLNLMQLI